MKAKDNMLSYYFKNSADAQSLYNPLRVTGFVGKPAGDGMFSSDEKGSRIEVLQAVFNEALVNVMLTIHDKSCAPEGSKVLPLQVYWELPLAKTEEDVQNILEKGGYEGIRDVVVDLKEFFAPQWDYDFTNICDDGKTFKRGGEVYTRPCGWKRYALNVYKKYGPDNRWLGCSGSADSGEWPVSYHGTNKGNAANIIKSEYRTGSRSRFGKGVYSTPDIKTAAKFALEKTESGDHQVVLQNRINPEKRDNLESGLYGYWIIPDGNTMRDHIRPYGILVKPIDES